MAIGICEFPASRWAVVYNLFHILLIEERRWKQIVRYFSRQKKTKVLECRIVSIMLILTFFKEDYYV
jgi:hypothetical protein